MPAGMDFSKIMGDPEIMAAMQNPKMMQVFMDMQQVVSVSVCGCVWMCVDVRVCVCVRARACVCACVLQVCTLGWEGGGSVMRGAFS